MKKLYIVCILSIYFLASKAQEDNNNIFEFSMNRGIPNNHAIGFGIGWKYINNFNQENRMNDQGQIYSPTISCGFVTSLNKRQNSFLAGSSGGGGAGFFPVMVGIRKYVSEQHISLEAGWTKAYIDNAPSKHTFCFAVEGAFISKKRYNLSLKYQGFKSNEKFYEGIISFQTAFKFGMVK